MAFAARAEGPWGGRVLRDVLARLANGWPAGLTVLTGDDLYHLDLAQSAILSHLVPDRSDAFAWTVLGDGPIAAGSLAVAASSSGMFATRRVVFLRDVASLEGEPEPLAAWAKSPPKDGHILVRAPKLDRKRKLHKVLAESGTCLTFRLPASNVEDKELLREIAALAASSGLVLDDDAMDLLVAVCGRDVNRIRQEIDKLAAWRGTSPDGKKVGAGAIRELVAGSALLTGWELADALLERDRAKALAAARRLCDGGAEPIRTLGGLAFRARALIQAKGLTERGVSNNDAIGAARAWFFREALARGMERYALPEALAMPGRLLAADRTFKSRSIDKGAVLEATVAALTAPPAGRAR